MAKNAKLDKELGLKADAPKSKSKAKTYHPVILNPDVNAVDPKKAKKATQKPKVEKEIIKKNQDNTLIAPGEHDSYFVYLKHPLEYRRHLLESSRKILLSLRGYQRILIIRQKKIEEMRNLKNSVRELLYLNKKFNDMLPKYNMPFVEHEDDEEDTKAKVKPAAKPQVAVKKEAPKVSAPAPKKTEIDRLEESLANIEKKLRTLQ